MKLIFFKTLTWLITIIFWLPANFEQITAQTLLCGNMTAPPPNGSNPDSLILDRFGNVYDMDDLLIPPPGSGGGCQSGFFNLTFDADFPVAMQPTICQVFTDLSNMLVEHSNSLACGGILPSSAVDIDVVWESLIPSYVLGTGTPFYSGPLDQACNEMILDRPFIKINGGAVDAFGGVIFDGRLEINADPTNVSGTIHHPWHINWTTPVGVDEVDLYSVALHEALHILGFASRIEFTEHSLWDRILHITDDFVPNGISPNVLPLLTNSPGALPCTSSLDNCWVLKAPEVTATNLPILIANTCSNNNSMPDVVVGEMPIAAIDWQNGGSIGAALSHLSESCNGANDVYVMRGGFDLGMERREISQDELQILCEIGYEINSPGYSCEGCYNIATQDREFNDDAPCCFKTYYACNGEILEIFDEDLLCNDVTNGPQQSVTRVWQSQGNTLVPVPNASGTGWLILIPTNSSISSATMFYTATGCNCRQHNSRFVITIDQQCPPCTFTPDPCDNLMCIGDFENFTNTIFGLETHLNWPIAFQNADVAGSPDINVTSAGNHYLHLGNYVNREAVNLELQKCIEPGCKLIMSMDLSKEGQASSFLEVWGSENRPCDATVLGAVPIAHNCGQATQCDITNIFDPVCIFETEFIANNQATNPDNPNFANSGPFEWLNITNQNVCFLTLVPDGGQGIFLDNISAQILCEPEITCNFGAPIEICEEQIGTITFQVCAPDIPDCLDLTLVAPTVILPHGWTLIGAYPGPFSLTEGQCVDVSIQVQMPPGTPIGTIVDIALCGTATGLCTSVDWCCEASVEVIDCPDPIGSCPCLSSNQINIDARPTNPYYDAGLGGTLYSVLEAVFNYDQNDDGVIDLSEHNNCMAIAGRLIIDTDLSITSCANVQMQPCSEISVGTGQPSSSFPTLDLSQNNIYGCEIMWHGITIQHYCQLIATDNFIYDAQFAVKPIVVSPFFAFQATRFFSIGNQFIRNHVGVFIPSGNIATSVLHDPFVNNQFIGSEAGKTLLPPCTTGLPNYDSQIGYAGVVTLGAAFDIGTPGNGGLVNSFLDIRNGVIGEGAWVNVHRANFENVPGYLGIFSTPSFNATSGIGVLLNNGLSSVQNSRFNNTGHGVYSRNSWLSVLSNEMPDVSTGIQMEGSNGFDFSKNQNIDFRDWGIYAKNLMNSGLFGGNFQIEDNILNSIEADNDPFVEAAISIGLANNTGENEDAHITDNIITLNDIQEGIGLGLVNNWRIDENQVTIEEHLLGLPHQGTDGILLSHSTQNQLYGNTVTDNSTNPLKATRGINAGTSPSNYYCLNTTEATNIGTIFQGDCDNTTLRRLITEDNDLFSLWCLPGTVISKQPDLLLQPGDNHSNEFHIGSWANHGGDLDQVRSSEFQVKTIVPFNHPDVILLPGIPGGYDPLSPEWFKVSGFDNLECSPVQEEIPPPRDERLSETDDYFATGGFLGSPYGDALNWEGRLRLYKRLQLYPALLGISSPVDSFYASTAGNEVGAYVAVDNAIAAIYTVPNSWDSTMQNALADIQNQIVQADSQLVALVSASTWEDSVAIYRSAEQTRLVALPAYQTLVQHIHLSDSLRNTKATAAWILNQALLTNDTLQSNRKMVNKVYLETVGLGIANLTTAQFATISPIAHQCPLEGGSAVYLARELYTMNQQGAFDDLSICGLNVQERSQSSRVAKTSNGISIQPNPASDQVLVSVSHIDLDNNLPLQVFDLNGKLMLSGQIPKGESKLSLNVAKLPAGIYICSIKGGAESYAPVKFIVQH